MDFGQKNFIREIDFFDFMSSFGLNFLKIFWPTVCILPNRVLQPQLIIFPFLSILVCFACQKGYLLPVNAMQYKSDWNCDSCENVVPYDLVNEVISTIEEQVINCFFFHICRSDNSVEIRRKYFVIRSH